MEDKNKGIELAEVLAGEEEEFHLTNNERLNLIQILGMVGAALKDGKLWFNQKGSEENLEHASFCLDIASRLSSMPVHEQS
jgi:hypothetical protein